MTTVKQSWKMLCPKCGTDDSINVFARVWLRLVPHGTDRDAAEDSVEDWDNGSQCHCDACGHAGTVGDFSTEQQ